MSETTPSAAAAPPPLPLSSVCPRCGAQTAYAPGTTSLRCGSCGSVLSIAESGLSVQEHSFDEWESAHGDVKVATIGGTVLQCQGCGASTETVDIAGVCQFCGGALVVTQQPDGLVPPEAVVPFKVDSRAARKHVSTWVGSRWFAPNALKKVGSAEGLTGTYVPHWTFDAHTETDYTGQRGDYYYTTETRQVSDGKGGTTTETYQQRHTAWHRESGHVQRDFDDVVVPASHRLPAKKLHKMGPWTLAEARPYQQEYLTGYSALRYDVDPSDGSTQARKEMTAVVHDDVEQDIGGDEQRVESMDVTYSRAMFKLVLLPLWIATYLYGGKTWQVLINANTGEVVGDRPYSVPKIVAAVLAVLVLLAVVVAVVSATRGGG